MTVRQFYFGSFFWARGNVTGVKRVFLETP